MKNCICVTFLVSLWSSLATLGFAFAPTIHNRGSLQRESFSDRLRQSRLLGQRTWYHDNGPEFNTYVQNIFQYDLLSPAEEVILTKQIQRGVQIETAFKTLKENLGRSPTANEWTEAVGVESIETIRTQLKRAGKSKSALINANVRLVLGICKKYRYNDISFQDLVQEGTMGLNKAAEKFDPSKGFRFSTYATWWVKEAVRKALARESSTVRMPAHFWDAINLYKRTKSDLYKEHNRAPTMEEIACKCKLPLHKVSGTPPPPPPSWSCAPSTKARQPRWTARSPSRTARQAARASPRLPLPRWWPTQRWCPRPMPTPSTSRRASRRFSSACPSARRRSCGCGTGWRTGRPGPWRPLANATASPASACASWSLRP
ncbi:unnamed protein product [Heterosigma akashiwo]